MSVLRHLPGVIVAPLIVMLLPAAAGGAPGRAGGEALGQFTVEAGPLDRRDTPVRVPLDAGLADKALEIGGGGAWYPLTRDPDGQGHFLLPALKQGQRRKLTLREARRPAKVEPARGVAVVTDDDGLWLTVGGKQLLRYQARPAAPAGTREDFLRGGYLHPVLTPSGTTVTDDYPADHKHHHGIWTAWTHTEYEGRTPDFWNMGQKKARKDHLAVDAIFGGPDAGGFVARLTSTDLQAAPPRVVIDERWKVIAYRIPAGRGRGAYHLFDLEWTDTVLGGSPLKLPEYRYGGLGVRGPIDWLGEKETTFLTSEGKDRQTAENTPARWCHMGGLVGGKTASKPASKSAGIAALDHPANFRHPQPLRISPNQPYFVYSPMKAGPFTIEAGKPFVSRYRFVVSDGPAEPALLERLWQDFARPPTVTALPAP